MVREYLNCVEQFGDHGCDPPEERGPTAALHFASVPGNLHEGPSLLFEVLHDPGRIHILHSGQENGVDSADLFQLAYILLYRPGVGREVLMGRKLGRVDEDRYDRLVVRFFRVVNEAEVSGMQRSHCGYKPN